MLNLFLWTCVRGKRTRNRPEVVHSLSSGKGWKSWPQGLEFDSRNRWKFLLKYKNTRLDYNAVFMLLLSRIFCLTKLVNSLCVFVRFVNLYVAIIVVLLDKHSMKTSWRADAFGLLNQAVVIRERQFYSDLSNIIESTLLWCTDTSQHIKDFLKVNGWKKFERFEIYKLPNETSEENLC